MSAYRPDLRTVKVKVLSSRGWVSGTVYVGKINIFLDVINAIPCFLKLADVSLQDGHKLPFLGLRLSAVQMIIPQEPENMIGRKNPADTAVKRVGCMLTSGNIEGELNLPADIRISDYMHKQEKFFLLRQTSGNIWQDDTGTSSSVLSERPSSLINAQQVIGITELSGWTPLGKM